MEKVTVNRLLTDRVILEGEAFALAEIATRGPRFVTIPADAIGEDGALTRTLYGHELLPQDTAGQALKIRRAFVLVSRWYEGHKDATPEEFAQAVNAIMEEVSVIC